MLSLHLKLRAYFPVIYERLEQFSDLGVGLMYVQIDGFTIIVLPEAPFAQAPAEWVKGALIRTRADRVNQE